MSKVLVFCHPREFDSTHFLYEFIVSQVPNSVVKTVDVVGNPDYKEDAFKRKFARDHQQEFDAMFLMDCGGDYMQTQPVYLDMDPLLDEDEKYLLKMNFIDTIVYITSNMLKPGGSMYLAKLYEDVQAIYEKKFLKRGWKVETGSYLEPYLKVTKPDLKF